MEVTIAKAGHRDDLMYGRQHLTGLPEKDIRFFDVPEKMIDEFRTCATHEIQSVIDKIKATCPELF